jgi:hypothetical protein
VSAKRTFEALSFRSSHRLRRLTFQNEDLTARIKEDLNVDATGRDFLPLPDLEPLVRDDVETLRSPS